MSSEELRASAFQALATAIPRIAWRFGGPIATAEILNRVWHLAATDAAALLLDASQEEAALAAMNRLAQMIAKKGGALPTELPPSETDSSARWAMLIGYQAVWDAIAAVTSGGPLPALVQSTLEQYQAAHPATEGSVLIGPDVPGRRLPRHSALTQSAATAALQATLPDHPKGQLQIVGGIAIWGQHDAGTLAQIQRCADDERVVGAAICADGHKGYAIPIGGVIAYQDAVSPNGVGFDIGCGIKAVRLDLRAEELLRTGGDGRTLLASAMDDIRDRVAFGVGRTNAQPVDHELFDDPTWQTIREVGRLRDLASQQLGTVGSGNHFVDLSQDDAGWVWIVCHFGSRGLGHKTATGFLNLAAGRRWNDRAPGEDIDAYAAVLALDTEVGQTYMQAMELAGRYAYAGRDYVTEQVRQILGASIVDEVHMHHNYAWRERHAGQDVVVVRKGATPAGPGVRGIIAGSMGTTTAIVHGVASPEAAVGFRSAPHGSGRVMSRTAAAGKRDRKTGKQLTQGLITPQMLHAAVTARGIELRGGGLDESPQAYRNIDNVLAAHAGVIEVETRLHPMGVAMAGEGEFDPYKD